MENTCQCGCGQKVKAGRRYINHHHSRSVPPPKEDPETGCLIWQGYVDPSIGYGQGWDPIIRRKEHAHRIAWRREKGEIQPKMQLHHTCGNRTCVNVDHLELHTARGHGRLTGNAKISYKIAREIRKRARAGERTTDLANEFGLTVQAIGSIKAGRTWQEDDVTCPKCGHLFDPYD